MNARFIDLNCIAHSEGYKRRRKRRVEEGWGVGRGMKNKKRDRRS